MLLTKVGVFFYCYYAWCEIYVNTQNLLIKE